MYNICAAALCTYCITPPRASVSLLLAARLQCRYLTRNALFLRLDPTSDIRSRVPFLHHHGPAAQLLFSCRDRVQCFVLKLRGLSLNSAGPFFL
jgi:hypothetical protein